ncbi:M48 family metalloprotease [Marinicella sp. S1101]|uniref:M48 family metalloprotease n=1 Tax=Marinicella marina TaxID=2996016 RepID=UPI002260B895|nr:M48 family metalloprotease [Marinicella marina]MCX7553372.1 M48 family metalloprotease [Marinicella marina]MDJ1139104.1 M48 family metalloprotease [Marinicella marina]
MRVLNIKNIYLIYIYYVLFGVLLLTPDSSLSQSDMEKTALFESAKKQEAQLIKTYGFYKNQLWQRKCNELLSDLELKQFKRCLIIGADFANAYSLAHGHVVLTKGLLENIRNDDQLAHILTHEHAHMVLNHHQQAQALVNDPPKFFTKSRIKKFYRQLEQEADDHADRWLSESHRDPLQIQHYLLRISKQVNERSADHVQLKHRIKPKNLPAEVVEMEWSGRR